MEQKAVFDVLLNTSPDFNEFAKFLSVNKPVKLKFSAEKHFCTHFKYSDMLEIVNDAINTFKIV